MSRSVNTKKVFKSTQTPKITLLRKADLTAAEWSGGRTTQLFIYPPAAEYARRDFDIRISTATVETTPSVFSKLDGYHRMLMPLTAPLTLDFGDGIKVERNPFETIGFDGGTPITAHGVCTDIGIMLSEGYTARLELIKKFFYDCAPITAIYALKDGVEVHILEDDYKLMSGDFLVIEPDSPLDLSVFCEQNSAIIALIDKLSN